MTCTLRARPRLYGLMAEFDTARRRSSTPRRTRDGAGYTTVDAYSPFPIEELHERIGMQRTVLPLIVLLGGIVGGMAPASGCSTGRRRSTTR